MYVEVPTHFMEEKIIRCSITRVVFGSELDLFAAFGTSKIPSTVQSSTWGEKIDENGNFQAKPVFNKI